MYYYFFFFLAIVKRNIPIYASLFCLIFSPFKMGSSMTKEEGQRRGIKDTQIIELEWEVPTHKQKKKWSKMEKQITTNEDGVKVS